jgi:hypothetical protein
LISNVICRNGAKRQLLPLAITLVDSELTYTKADSPGEWQLAKMALHATEVNFQQMRHFVETHLVSVPVQVEMIRLIDNCCDLCLPLPRIESSNHILTCESAPAISTILRLGR